jgi:hypothetical protein
LCLFPQLMCFNYQWCRCAVPGLVCIPNHTQTTTTSQPGVVPSLHWGKKKLYLPENELYLGVKSCIHWHGTVVLRRRKNLTGNHVGTFDTQNFWKNLLAAHQNTHSYHIRSPFPSPYLMLCKVPIVIRPMVSWRGAMLSNGRIGTYHWHHSYCESIIPIVKWSFYYRYITL